MNWVQRIGKRIYSNEEFLQTNQRLLHEQTNFHVDTTLTEKLNTKKGSNVLSTKASLHLSGFTRMYLVVNQHFDSKLKKKNCSNDQKRIFFCIFLSTQQRRRLCTFGNLYFHFSKTICKLLFQCIIYNSKSRNSVVPKTFSDTCFCHKFKMSQIVVAKTK